MKGAKRWIRLGVDANFIADTSAGAWGAVVRDENGQVPLMSAWVSFINRYCVETAEAIAWLDGFRVFLQGLRNYKVGNISRACHNAADEISLRFGCRVLSAGVCYARLGSDLHVRIGFL